MQSDARDLAARTKRWVAARPSVQRLRYARQNRTLFSDLYQHDRMLADSVRTDAYWRAIEKHIGPDDVVVDLGTGTGVLSLFAARQGATVHAIEHSPLIEAAEAIAVDNGLADKMQFHNLNSRRFDLDGGADVLIHEQIGEALFDERVVDNIADLRDRVLRPGGRIYPSLLTLYVEPVQVADHLRAPFAWQQNLHGISFAKLEDFARPSRDYVYRALRPFPLGQFLCEPAGVLTADLMTASASTLPRRIEYEREVVTDGVLDGFCVYFDAHFDDEIWFTSSPAEVPTSWGSPWLRVESRDVRAGQKLHLLLEADDLERPASWNWTCELRDA